MHAAVLYKYYTLKLKELALNVCIILYIHYKYSLNIINNKKAPVLYKRIVIIFYIRYKSSSNTRAKCRRHLGRAIIDHNGWINDAL